MATALLSELETLLRADGAVFEENIAEVTAADVLFVIDMQYDFCPGGSFAVPEGDAIEGTVAELMRLFAQRGGTILCSRDYHPVDHCSFTTRSGPFPPHCAQSSQGSHFMPKVGAVLNELLPERKAFVLFKGFSRDIDSFGAVQYSDSDVEDRLSRNPRGQFCESTWTGGYSLFSSSNDCNAAPDVMSILEPQSAAQILGPATAARRIFVCGLAFDFCVLDTALNAAGCGFTHVAIVLDAARASHVPGLGKFGSGFLSDTKVIAGKLKSKGVLLTSTTQLR